MSRQRDGGRMLVAGCGGTDLAAEEARILDAVRPFGVILFRRNVATAEQVRSLISSIREAAPGTLLFVDAEGGRVDRLADAVAPAPAGDWLAARPPRSAQAAGRWVGHALRGCGFDVDFAPVVDLDHGMVSNALDGRYLGSSPRSVVARGRAFLDGLAAAGIGGCVKHFPGLGRAGKDTHFHGARITASRDELVLDLEPFARLGQAAGAVMVGHATYPALDPDERPASLSPPILGPLLRGELGFAGAAFGDDAEMKALAPWGDLPTRCAAKVAAGCDAVLVCSRIGELPAVAERLGTEVPKARRVEAIGRLERYRDSVVASRRAARSYRLETVRSRLARLSA